MAEVLLSPGVLARENDQSLLTAQPVQAGAAIVGPTVKGPVGIPTVVTSYSEYQNTFGAKVESGSAEYSYFTSISAYNYFQQGGDSLLVTRVVSGSFSSATSSLVSNELTTDAFVLETFTEGIIANSVSPEGTNNTLSSGSIDNLRWEIVSPNTSSGTFNLLIRRGNDTSKQKVILETWPNLSMDPNSDNFITKVIGDAKQTVANEGSDYYLKYSGEFSNSSRYVRVKSVGTPTLNYLDNNGSAKDALTGSIPLAGSGSFGDASGAAFASGRAANFYGSINNIDTQGLDATDYTATLNLLANQDLFQYNVVATPGLIKDFSSHSSLVTKLVDTAQTRGDNLAIVDLVAYEANIGTVTTEAASIDSSYAATYWPWLQTIDPDLGSQVFVPASAMMLGVFAFNDRASETWFAPAGLNRGGLSTVIRAERNLTNSNRDTLYTNNVNPIATFPNTGVVVFGQKTLQKKASALDRVNVRRLLITIKSFISQIADNLVFEQNSIATRNNFLSQVNPYLASVQQRQGLYAFKVVMDESNNTPDVIDRNQLVGQIYVQPTKTAEFIYLDFNVLPTGATFPA
jgi:phage tail sheath protein FI